MSDKKLEEKLAEGREYRRFHNIEIREEAKTGRGGFVTGYATTFNEYYLLYDYGDYKVYEQVDARAFDECDMSDVIMQYDHMGRVFARTSNRTLQLTPDSKGLRTDADLTGTALGADVYDEIKGGYSTKMSFGFRVKESKREIVEDQETNTTIVYRTITKISKLYDVSVVSLPANDGTDISARNFSDGLIAEIKAERQRAEEHQRKVKILKLMMEVNNEN